MLEPSWSFQIYDALLYFFYGGSTPDDIVMNGWFFLDIAYYLIMSFCIFIPFFVFYKLFRLFFV